MFDTSKNTKKNIFEYVRCNGTYESTFFKPFDSLADAKSNLKAIAFKPLVDISLVLRSLVDCLIYSTFGLANLVFGAITLNKTDLSQGSNDLKKGITKFFSAGYFAISIITDTLDSILRLMTHTLGTIGFGLGIVNNERDIAVVRQSC